LPGATDWFGMIAPTDTRADCRPPIPGDVVREHVACLSIGHDHYLHSDQAARAFADRYCDALIDLAG